MMRYDELNNEAKKRANEKVRDLLAEDDWYDWGLKDDLVNLWNERTGMDIDEKAISFSLAYVQGDYVHVTLTDEVLTDKLLDDHVDLETEAAKLDAADLEALGITTDDVVNELREVFTECTTVYNGGNDSRYGYFATSCTTGWFTGPNVEIDRDSDEFKRINEALDDIYVDVENRICDALFYLEREMYRRVRDEWECLTSDESLAEYAIANELEFEEDGELI